MIFVKQKYKGKNMKKIIMLIVLFAMAFAQDDLFSGWNVLEKGTVTKEGLVVHWEYVGNKNKTDIVVSKIELPGMIITIIGTEDNTCSGYFADHKNIVGTVDYGKLGKQKVKLYFYPELAYVFHDAQVRALKAYKKL